MTAKRLIFAFVFVTSTMCFSAFSQADNEPVLRGRKPLAGPFDGHGYRKNWAILIGINYTGRQEELSRDRRNADALPELKNAANDAKKLAEVLRRHYHYDDPDSIIVLTDDGDDDDKPTASRITEEINNLCLPDKVQPNDSVLIFFAGHGFKLGPESASKGDAVAVLPYDVTISQGQPVGTKRFDLPDGLFKLIDKIPSQHKLLILDCCYSGEIFNARGSVGFQSPVSGGIRSDKTLQVEPTFQAIASCRATQVASDGRDGNSKFTTALLDALKHIPARSDGNRRVWATRLLSYIRPSFDDSQRPECRNLIGTSGEFAFYPKGIAAFEGLGLGDEGKSHLKAMVVSRQGRWWFDEMPWFIPSVRSEIIKEHEGAQEIKRSNFSELIEAKELKATAEKLFLNRADIVDNLVRFRIECARDLLNGKASNEFDDSLELVETKLTTLLTKEQLAATTPTREVGADDNTQKKIILGPEDLHLLAVIQHALAKKEEAELSYERAIKAYRKRLQNDDQSQLSYRLLLAVCHADYGEFFARKLREPEKAAKEFAEARRVAVSCLPEENRGQDAAAFFRISMLCREAQSLVSLNRWKQADSLFSTALDVAEALAPNHYLQAHVYRQNAWAKIYNWKIGKAKCFFENSNKILQAHFSQEARKPGDSPKGTDSVNDEEIDNSDTPSADAAANAPTIADTPPTLRAQTHDCRIQVAPKRLGMEFYGSKDHESKIAFLHNLHGMAMASRFQGEEQKAAEIYRWISSEVEDAFTRFQVSATNPEQEQAFVGRVINTLERLGDCNLFGKPETQDPAEAVDDYRRALSRVHFLRKWEDLEEPLKNSERQAALLLYKQALALSLPSPIQNTELALTMCKKADVIFETQNVKATGRLKALGRLTTPTVQLIHDSLNTNPVLESTTAKLRTSILAFRDEIGRSPQLDELELSLFASKVLVESGGSNDTYQVLEDANILLSFCRIGLTPFRVQNGEAQPPSESRKYLRPYYDVAMRAKLKCSPGHVRELMEIQFEATQGTHYVKPSETSPTIALYAVDQLCYLLVNLPCGKGLSVSMTDKYKIDEIQLACTSLQKPLKLPREVSNELLAWTESQPVNREELPVICRWFDPVSGIGALKYDFSQRNNEVETTFKPTAQFPFELPQGFVVRPLHIDKSPPLLQVTNESRDGPTEN